MRSPAFESESSAEWSRPKRGSASAAASAAFSLAKLASESSPGRRTPRSRSPISTSTHTLLRRAPSESAPSAAANMASRSARGNRPKMRDTMKSIFWGSASVV